MHDVRIGQRAAASAARAGGFPDWELPVFSTPKQRMNSVVRVVTRMAPLFSIRPKLFGRLDRS